MRAICAVVRQAMPSASRIVRIILISIVVISDVAAVGYIVFMPLAAISFIAAMFCDNPGATVGQCVGKAISTFLPEIVLFVYAPFFTVFVLVNLITVRFLMMRAIFVDLVLLAMAVLTIVYILVGKPA